MERSLSPLVPLYPVVPLDIPEDYAGRVVKQMEGLLFLGINLPFARNLLQYVEEKRVLFIAYSNFQKEQIKFESSDRKFQIIPRDKMVLDTLSAYFEDFLDWKEELFRRKLICINFGDSPGEFMSKVMENLLALQDFPLDFSLVLSNLDDQKTTESMFQALKLRKRRKAQGFRKDEQFVYFIQAGKERKVKIGISNSIDSRLKQLQTGCPYPLKFLAVIPGGRELEKEL